MLNLILQEAAKLFGNRATEDIGVTGDAIASGDVKKMAGTAWDTLAPLPVQMATYSPEAQAIFGGAGRQDLMLSRGLGTGSLLRRLAESNLNPFRKSLNIDTSQLKETPKLISPSLAIHSIYSPNNFARDGVELVFNPKYFDPADTARAKLYSRDIYTYNSPKSGLEALGWHGKKQFFDPRLTESINPATYVSMPNSEIAAILQAKPFGSLAEWEASPYGAAILDKYNDPTFSTGRFRRRLDSLIEKEFKLYDIRHDKGSEPYVKKVNDAFNSASTDVQKRILDLAAKSPVDYAELKMRGHVPLDSSTLLGVIMDNNASLGIEKELIKEKLPNIPILEADLSSPASHSDAMNELYNRIIGKRPGGGIKGGSINPVQQIKE